MSYSGVVESFYYQKNYGFIKTRDWEHDIFLHIQNVAETDRDSIKGAKVAFDIEFNSACGKIHACNVTVLEPGGSKPNFGTSKGKGRGNVIPPWHVKKEELEEEQIVIPAYRSKWIKTVRKTKVEPEEEQQEEQNKEQEANEENTDQKVGGSDEPSADGLDTESNKTEKQHRYAPY